MQTATLELQRLELEQAIARFKPSSKATTSIAEPPPPPAEEDIPDEPPVPPTPEQDEPIPSPSIR